MGTVTRKRASGIGVSDPTHTLIVDYSLAASATAIEDTFIALGATHVESISVVKALPSGATAVTGTLDVRLTDENGRNVLGGAASAVPASAISNGTANYMPLVDGSQKYPAQVYGSLTLSASGNTASGASFRILINASM